MTTLEQIRDLEAGAAYPGYLLEGCETALVLFSAGFLGRQDCVWVAEAGLTATCVDEDAAKLALMAELYPAGWEFVVADVFAFVSGTDRRWDVVSADPWTQDFARTAAALPALAALASRAVILGTGATTTVTAPDAWQVTEVRKRSDYDGGVYWTCLEPT